MSAERSPLTSMTEAGVYTGNTGAQLRIPSDSSSGIVTCNNQIESRMQAVLGPSQDDHTAELKAKSDLNTGCNLLVVMAVITVVLFLSGMQNKLEQTYDKSVLRVVIAFATVTAIVLVWVLLFAVNIALK